MNMLQNMLGGMISDDQKVEAITDIIKDALEDNAEEMGCTYEEIFFVIKPKNDDYDFDVVLYKIEKEGPKMIRIIPLKEIIE